MRSQDITKGYYWVKFYNHEEKQIMLFNGKNFEGFKSDRFIHDEIESYEPIERGQNYDMGERQSNIPDVSGSVLFDFAAYLTGHDIDTVKQMYDDWWNSPLTHKYQQY
jgi:hypothetical protein